MPSYHYRCSHCQQESIHTHGMLETITPVCEACGHFCAKVILSAPQVVDSLAKPEQNPLAVNPVEGTHQCGSDCVLHRRSLRENFGTETQTGFP
jgi:putative FmdB family regulatory protein